MANVRLRFFSVVLAVLAAGCGGVEGGDGDGDADAGPIDTSGLTFNECAPADRVGGFTASLNDGFSATGGQLTDAVSPLGLLETITEDGPCRHARAATLFCDPGCEAGELCGVDGLCGAAPVSRDAGTVTIRGLAVPVEMTPIVPGFTYTNPESLPHPAFALGDGIALDSSGGDFEDISLLGVGIAPLEMPAQSVALAAGSPLDLSWTPLATEQATRVHIELNINLHGAAGSRIECEVPDTGSFSIPEPMVTALVNDGLSGFPSIILERASADSTTITPGCVDFKVQSQLALEVEIPGLESCNFDTDCTPPETCQPDLTCGE